LFEDSIAGKNSGRPAGRDRAIGLLVTLLFHAGVALAIIFGRFTVRMLPFAKEEVREVMIVPPLKVAIPRIVGGHGLAELPVAPAGRPGLRGRLSSQKHPVPRRLPPPTRERRPPNRPARRRVEGSFLLPGRERPFPRCPRGSRSPSGSTASPT
jgi:hypothetical protein